MRQADTFDSGMRAEGNKEGGAERREEVKETVRELVTFDRAMRVAWLRVVVSAIFVAIRTPKALTMPANDIRSILDTLAVDAKLKAEVWVQFPEAASSLDNTPSGIAKHAAEARWAKKAGAKKAVASNTKKKE